MLAFRSIMSSRLPMVIILGATGTGKTKLGVELAKKFKTEIISADSMQIYKGLDIVTAKASNEEQQAVRHHLLDILEPHQIFTVVDFRSRALKIIDNLLEQEKIPIIVGGTNYYVESIVYNILVEDTDDTEELLWDKSRRKRDFKEDHEDIAPSKVAKEAELEKATLPDGTQDTEDVVKDLTKEDVVEDLTKENVQIFVDNENKYTSEQIHNKLKAIDPDMASRLHPNNRRKVLRSIEVWLKSGRRHSDLLQEQKTSEGKLRRPGATIILWLKCDQTVHDARLNARVDAMLQNGLIQELLDFHDRHNKQRIKEGMPADYTKGVFQTLGFKEFHEYLMMSEDQRQSDEGKKLLQLGIENMKMATRRYARRQNKMTRGRFLEHPNRDVPPIYELDATDVSKWEENVTNKAIHIIQSHLDKKEPQYEPLKSNKLQPQNLNPHSSNYCEICERLIIGDKEYGIHQNSSKHNKVIKAKKRAEELKIKKGDISQEEPATD